MATKRHLTSAMREATDIEFRALWLHFNQPHMMTPRYKSALTRIKRRINTEYRAREKQNA